jgi:hypothetical protein
MRRGSEANGRTELEEPAETTGKPVLTGVVPMFNKKKKKNCRTILICSGD